MVRFKGSPCVITWLYHSFNWSKERSILT